MSAAVHTTTACRYCADITACAICGKGYAAAVRADALANAERALRVARAENRCRHGEPLHPLDECRLHPGNRRSTCEHCEASR